MIRLFIDLFLIAVTVLAGILLISALVGDLVAFGQEAAGTTSEGGAIGPNGVQVQTDLPVELRMRNTGGRDGNGLCVFTSIQNAARYHNEQRLWNFQANMRKELGGGYPSKVDAMIAKYGKGTQYIQHTGGDLEFIYAAISKGRMVCVTYDAGPGDPHYGGSIIAHMVNCVYLGPPDQKPVRMACILDNNYIGANQLVWQTADEFSRRWKGKGGGWAFVLLNVPPAPAPKLPAAQYFAKER
jgi:hypothetical protein